MSLRLFHRESHDDIVDASSKACNALAVNRDPKVRHA